ncbi:MAG: hypothetical protein LBK65_10835 [Tannerellaceae bacterium]|nr:hypothetical protein [Tannerellaceae bacterium]
MNKKGLFTLLLAFSFCRCSNEHPFSFSLSLPCSTPCSMPATLPLPTIATVEAKKIKPVCSTVYIQPGRWMISLLSPENS